MTICKRVMYTGTVQGVGFRWGACQLARRFGVSGSVRNCSDGSVELVVQGPRTEVESFLTALAQQRRGFIKDQVIDDLTASGTTPNGFQIID